MSVSPTALPAFSGEVSLSGFGEIEKQLVRFRIVDLGTDRNLHNVIVAVFTESIGAFAVMAALGLVLRIVSEMKERVETLGRFKPYRTTNAAVAAGRAASRNKFFTAKRGDAVAAVTGLYPYFYSVKKHR